MAHGEVLGFSEFDFEASEQAIVAAVGIGIEQIRELSRQQVDTWKRIPFWALLSEGRSGYSGVMQRAYAHGLWTLSTGSSKGYYFAAVDLDNGEIVTAGNPGRSAPDRAVLSLAPDKLDRLNAAKILDGLVKDCRQPVRSYAAGSPSEVAHWHREMMEKHNISEYYVRPEQLNAEEIARQEIESLASDLAPSA